MREGLKSALGLALGAWVVGGCGDIAAKHADKEVASGRFSINMPTIDFDTWRVTFTHAGQPDQSYARAKGSVLDYAIAPGTYQVRLDLLKAGFLVSSNAVPPCHATEALLAKGGQLKIALQMCSL